MFCFVYLLLSVSALTLPIYMRDFLHSLSILSLPPFLFSLALRFSPVFTQDFLLLLNHHIYQYIYIYLKKEKERLQHMKPIVIRTLDQEEGKGTHITARVLPWVDLLKSFRVTLSFSPFVVAHTRFYLPFRCLCNLAFTKTD